MKLIKLKNIAFAAIALLAIGTQSCTKVATVEPLGDSGQKYIRFLTYGGTADNFGNSGLAFNPSSTSEILDLNVEYITSKVEDKDIQITIAPDTNLVAAYNTTQTSPLKQYKVLNASAFTFPSQTVLIKAGQTVSETFHIEFNPSQIDGSKNFMIPIAIKTITGAPSDVKRATSTGVAYFHFIGNPLAGTYNVVGTRYNCSAAGDQGWAPQAGWAYPQALVVPATFATAAIPTSKFLGPVTPTVTTTYVANLGAGTDRDYFFTIDPAVTTTTDIQVDFTPSFANGISNIRWFQKTYDPVTKRIILLFTYNNQPAGAGNDRIIYEVMTKP